MAKILVLLVHTTNVASCFVRFLECNVNLMDVVDSPPPKVRKQIVLDGPCSCGKSIALAMLAHWACDEGWLVFYAPKGRDWTHEGFFYKNPQTGLWDTPVQAEHILKASSYSCFASEIHDLECNVKCYVSLQLKMVLV